MKEGCAGADEDEAIPPARAARLPRDQAPARRSHLRAAVAGEAEAEMAEQLELLDGRRDFDGYVEIGSPGATSTPAQAAAPAASSPGDDVPRPTRRGHRRARPARRSRRLRPARRFQPIAPRRTCRRERRPRHLLHRPAPHPPHRLEPFMRSIARMLRPGGTSILRDHDVTTPQMDAFVCLAHAVSNAGLDVPWKRTRRAAAFRGGTRNGCAASTASACATTGSRGRCTTRRTTCRWRLLANEQIEFSFPIDGGGVHRPSHASQAPPRSTARTAGPDLPHLPGMVPGATAPRSTPNT